MDGKKFHRSWNAMEKDTGIDRNTLKRAMWKAQKLGLLEFSFARRCDHWFWLGEKLEQAMIDAFDEYDKYLDRRNGRHIWTKRVPEAVEDLRSRLFAFQAKRRWKYVFGSSSLQVIARLKAADIYWLQTAEACPKDEFPGGKSRSNVHAYGCRFGQLGCRFGQ